MAGLWDTPANLDWDPFPDMTEEEIMEILESIGWDEVHHRRKEDKEFQKRLIAFRPRRMRWEDLLKPIY